MNGKRIQENTLLNENVNQIPVVGLIAGV